MSVTTPNGFRAAGVTAGLKPSGKPDVALVVNDGPVHSAAAVFTSNRCKANPVLWSEQVVKDGQVRAVVLNSGGANCFTGADGFRTTHETAELVADRLRVSSSDVVVCSTGLIGEFLERDKLSRGLEDVIVRAHADGGPDAATAIMTTDTRSKQSTYEGDGWTVGGMAKGAGMLAPGLATMLVVLTTDANVDAATADKALRAAASTTFDRIDSDGCMSTNDTVLLMVSGASGESPAYDEFAEAVRSVCHDLAQQLLSDAEGAEHDIAIEVVGAASESDALKVGREIARGNLLKCAIYGKDPNWGRVIASVGVTDAVFDPARLDVAFNGVWVCKDSGIEESRDKVDLSDRKVAVTVNLKAGEHSATIWTNDLTTAYVHENSAYST